MSKYLVVSYDSDQQQWFYDTVRAEDNEKAEEFICKIRPYVIAADASTSEDFGVNASLTVNETEWDAGESLSECQDCQVVIPQSRLRPIEDLSQRVEAEEPMPSGECPECGALCHLVEVAQ